jgi:Chaperone of endosialidase
MKKIITRILVIACVVTSARADIPLTVGVVSYGTSGPCWDDTVLVVNPPAATGTFTLPGVTGNGVINSSVAYVADNVHGQQHLHYVYSVDMSAMSAAVTHCVKLLIHFGTPHTCAYDVLVSSVSGVAVSSASKAPFGDITFLFNGGCLAPPEMTAPFGMLCDVPPKTNVVTVIDDYYDPAGGPTNEVRINVTAVVPDIPPNWAYAPMPIPNPSFQGIINNCNSIPIMTNISGPFNFTLQLVDAASNGLPVGPTSTQTVQVVNGLFNVPLSFDPISMGDGSARWLNLGVKPSKDSGPLQFLTPALPLTPTPQALFAYSAGVVADISPNQAVLSLNGLTGNVMLQSGPGILLNSSGNAITISAQPGVPSDRNLKTDFASVKPEDILDRVAMLPISSWRYTNEVAGVRHLGPMAQDFKTLFDLGADSRMIGFVDEQGVALAAIQALNQKLQEQAGRLKAREAEVQILKEENADLQKRMENLEQAMKQTTERK